MAKTQDHQAHFTGEVPPAGPVVKKSGGRIIRLISGGRRRPSGTSTASKQIAALTAAVEELKRQRARDAAAVADLKAHLGRAKKRPAKARRPESEAERNVRLAKFFAAGPDPDEISEAVAENIRQSRLRLREAEAAASRD